MSDRLLDLDEVAAVLACSRATVKRRVQEGALPAFRDGRLVRVRPADLDRFITERVTRAVSANGVSAGGVVVPPGKRLWD